MRKGQKKKTQGKKTQGKNHGGRKQGKGGWILGICLAVCTIAAAFTLYLMQKDRTAAVLPSPAASGGTVAGTSQTMEDGVIYKGTAYTYNKNLKNILFLGVDRKLDAAGVETAGRNGQADCILLLVMDKETRRTTLLQISRDSMVQVGIYDISGRHLADERMQIALQYAYGDSDTKSCWLMKAAVSELLYGIPVDSCLSLTVEGIAAITDAMGGVTVTVPQDYTAIDESLQAGASVSLKGSLAERYVRYRDTDVTGSNSQRMQRQNEFLKAMFTQMKGERGNAAFYNHILDSASPYMTSDLDAEELKALSEYDMGDAMLEVPGTVSAGAVHDEFKVDDQKLYELILELFYRPVEK